MLRRMAAGPAERRERGWWRGDAPPPWRPPAHIMPDASALDARSAARGVSVLDRPERRLWAVADGAGAPAVIAALALLADAATPGPHAIRTVLERANAAMRLACVSGASVVALHLDHGVATLLWAGDCRAYRCRDGMLDPLTRDHSVVQELIDTGLLPPAEVAAHPHVHVVTRAIGAAPQIEIETRAVPVAAGDVLLLCSRALPQRVPAAMIARRVRAPVADAVDALVEAAFCAGVREIVSLVAIEVR